MLNANSKNPIARFGLKKSLFYGVLLCISLQAAETYKNQIRVWDDCTYAMEKYRDRLMQMRGKRFEEINATQAVAVCEKSLSRYPDDPHVKSLLARAYIKNRQNRRAQQLASEACRAGDISGCSLLGGMHTLGMTEHPDPKKSFLLYLWGCTRGDSQACLNLYWQAEKHSAYLPREIRKTDAKMLYLCLRGDYPPICHQHAMDLFAERRDGSGEYEYTISRSCLSGNREGCFLYKKLLNDKKIQNRKAKELYVYTKSCNNGNGEACVDVAHYYGSKKRTKINNITTLALYEDTCRRGLSATACRYAGSYYLARLEGIDRNITLGLTYLEASCTPKRYYEETSSGSSSRIDIDLYGCRDLVDYYLKAPPKEGGDITKAQKVLERTCKQPYSYDYLNKTGCRLGITSCCKKTRR